MDASKQNSATAQVRLGVLWSAVSQDTKQVLEKDFVFVREFLQAAERKLPKQETFDKERK